MEAPETQNGMTRRSSATPFDVTLERLRSALAGKNVTLFATIDHAAEAAKAGLRMPPTQVLIFGNPKAGTPLMLAAPSLALDLPMKILVSEENGKTWLTYNTAEFLAERHGLPPDLLGPLSAAEQFAKAAAG